MEYSIGIFRWYFGDREIICRLFIEFIIGVWKILLVWFEVEVCKLFDVLIGSRIFRMKS